MKFKIQRKLNHPNALEEKLSDVHAGSGDFSSVMSRIAASPRISGC
jgi:hypothetical protein